MASRESDSLNEIISRRRRKILNDGIFELSDEDRDSPTHFEKSVDTNIANNDSSHIISSAVSEVTTLIKSPILNPDLENSVESGELNSTDLDSNVNEIDELKSENERLTQELEILKSQKCTCNMTIEGPEPQKPLFTLSFRDRDTAVKYKSDILTFLYKLVNCSSRKECRESDLEIDLWENESNNDSDIDFQDLFVVDSDPAIIQNNRNIPYYKNVSKQTITENEKQKEKNYFNSGELHQSRDGRFQASRQQFSRNNSLKSSRYHQEDEINNRISDLKPGKISEKLRHALGLRCHELPRHIYKMRILGYPPGWLEEAMSQKSGLKLFTEKDIDENSHSKLISEDMIYEYPGFNMPLSHGTKDDYLHYKSPPFQYSQTKEALLKVLSGSGDKNSTLNRDSPPINIAVSNADMDIDDCSVEQNISDINIVHVEDIRLPEKIVPPGELLLMPPLPSEPYVSEAPPTPPPPPPPLPELDDVPLKHNIHIDSSEELSQSSADQNSLSSHATSLSLSDLETQKRLLLSELQKEGIDKSSLLTELENQDLSVIKNNESVINLDDSSLIEKSNNTVCTPKNNDSIILLSPNVPFIDLTSPVCENSDHVTKTNLSSTPLKRDVDCSANTTNLVHTSPQINPEYSNIPLPGESVSNNENNFTVHTKCNIPSQFGAVKFTLKGTPILKSVSPYANLPDQSKFAKDMGPMLNYENLPDSTGKYERMKDLIKRVRLCYKQILDKH